MNKAEIRAKAEKLADEVMVVPWTELPGLFEAALTQVRQKTLLEVEGICMGSLTLENAVHAIRRLRIEEK